MVGVVGGGGVVGGVVLVAIAIAKRKRRRRESKGSRHGEQTCSCPHQVEVADMMNDMNERQASMETEI